METDPFPSKFMSDVEYSVIKSFDCILFSMSTYDKHSLA